MAMSANAILSYVQLENQHPRLVGVFRNHINKYYFPDMNAAIAVIVRLNQYLNFRTDGDDLFMITTKFKYKDRKYNTNKGIVNLFLQNEAYIKEACREIVRVGSAVQSFERNWVTKLSVPVIGDMVGVGRYVADLRKQLADFEDYTHNQKELTALAGERLVCSSNRQAYARTFELDCELMYATLCDDVIGVIREFVGEEFMESVRRKTISNKYFPVPRKDSLVLMLSKWRLGDLKYYAKHMFITCEFRSIQRVKHLLIEQIIAHKLRFFELHRDIVCITKVLMEKRERERALSRAVAKDRATALALTRVPS